MDTLECARIQKMGGRQGNTYRIVRDISRAISVYFISVHLIMINKIHHDSQRFLAK